MIMPQLTKKEKASAETAAKGREKNTIPENSISQLKSPSISRLILGRQTSNCAEQFQCPKAWVALHE